MTRVRNQNAWQRARHKMRLTNVAWEPHFLPRPLSHVLSHNSSRTLVTCLRHQTEETSCAPHVTLTSPPGSPLPGKRGAKNDPESPSDEAALAEGTQDLQGDTLLCITGGQKTQNSYNAHTHTACLSVGAQRRPGIEHTSNVCEMTPEQSDPKQTMKRTS